MPTLYMIFWSFVMIAALGIWRLRNLRQIIVVVIVTPVVLLFSQTLFVQLAVNAGMDPSIAAVNPFLFLDAGPLGLLALLVMPCGWLGPIIGLNLVQRWSSEA